MQANSNMIPQREECFTPSERKSIGLGISEVIGVSTSSFGDSLMDRSLMVYNARALGVLQLVSWE